MTTLDTHAIIKDLVASGISEKQAEVFVAKFVPKEQLGDLDEKVATKADIANVRTEIIEVRSEITSIKTDLKWMKAALLGIIGLLVKLAFFNQ